MQEHDTDRTLPFDGFFIAIGASGGEGLCDIERLLAGLPDKLPAVVMVVLHRPSDQISHLRAILARASALPVRIAEQGEVLRAGVCYIGEPDKHLLLSADSLGNLLPDPGNAHRNRTIDALFISIAEFAGEHFVGIVLSGSLDDGSRGLAAIHAAGGLTMVLTPSHQSGNGMPENAIRFDGPIDFVGSPEAIADEIVQRVTIRTQDGTSRR